MAAMPGPYEEVVVGCTLGRPTLLATDRPSTGRSHRALTTAERATRWWPAQA